MSLKNQFCNHQFIKTEFLTLDFWKPIFWRLILKNWFFENRFSYDRVLKTDLSMTYFRGSIHINKNQLKDRYSNLDITIVDILPTSSSPEINFSWGFIIPISSRNQIIPIFWGLIGWNHETLSHSSSQYSFLVSYNDKLIRNFFCESSFHSRV